MTKEELEGKFIIGKLHEDYRPGYVAEYEKIIKRFTEEEDSDESDQPVGE